MQYEMLIVLLHDGENSNCTYRYRSHTNDISFGKNGHKTRRAEFLHRAVLRGEGVSTRKGELVICNLQRGGTTSGIILCR